MSDIPHLRQMDEATVNALCDRVMELGPSHGIRLEAFAFRESRTPWDATRLANALAMMVPPIDIPRLRIVVDIDRAAEACTGGPLPNKGRRPAEDPPYDGVSG